MYNILRKCGNGTKFKLLFCMLFYAYLEGKILNYTYFKNCGCGYLSSVQPKPGVYAAHRTSLYYVMLRSLACMRPRTSLYHELLPVQPQPGVYATQNQFVPCMATCLAPAWRVCGPEPVCPRADSVAPPLLPHSAASQSGPLPRPAPTSPYRLVHLAVNVQNYKISINVRVRSQRYFSYRMYFLVSLSTVMFFCCGARAARSRAFFTRAGAELTYF